MARQAKLRKVIVWLGLAGVEGRLREMGRRKDGRGELRRAQAGGAGIGSALR